MTTKYFNKPMTVDGIKFDSKLETETYNTIKKACTTLHGLQENVGYIVLPHTQLILASNLGELGYNIPKITYSIDFLVLKINTSVNKIIDFVFIEPKGFCTKDFKIKLNIFLRLLIDFNYRKLFESSYILNNGNQPIMQQYFMMVISDRAMLQSYSGITKMNVSISKLSDLYIDLIDRFSWINSEFQGITIDPFWTRLDTESRYYKDGIIKLKNDFLYNIGM